MKVRNSHFTKAAASSWNFICFSRSVGVVVLTVTGNSEVSLVRGGGLSSEYHVMGRGGSVLKIRGVVLRIVLFQCERTETIKQQASAEQASGWWWLVLDDGACWWMMVL